MMSPCSLRKARISPGSRVISVGGVSSGNSVTKSFSGALRTSAGSLTTSVFGMDALEEMRGGDVGHVEGRVLAEQHHVEAGEVGDFGGPEREMVALRRRAPDRLDPRLDPAVAHARGGRACSGRACGRAARASSISAKVELPRDGDPEMWSIWTATVSGMSAASLVSTAALAGGRRRGNRQRSGRRRARWRAAAARAPTTIMS